MARAHFLENAPGARWQVQAIAVEDPKNRKIDETRKTSAISTAMGSLYVTVEGTLASVRNSGPMHKSVGATAMGSLYVTAVGPGASVVIHGDSAVLVISYPKNISTLAEGHVPAKR